MRALHAQPFTQHHIPSIGGQTAGPIEPQIGTNTHWDNGLKVWRSAGAKRENEREAREYMDGTWRHSVARSNKKKKMLRNLRQT
jgi:hypothetical protein